MNIPSWLPLATPAIKAESCEVDRGLLLRRITIVGAATLFTTIAYPAIFPFTVIIIPIVIFSIAAIDNWVSERAADVKAVNEYINIPFPADSATRRIQQNMTAAKLFVAKGGDVNKLNVAGDRLLDHTFDLKIFAFFVSVGADIQTPDKLGYTALHKAVRHANPSYLEVILKNRKVNPNDFVVAQQMQFWSNLGSIKTGQLLSQLGFDLNIRDDKGYTPLLRAAKEYRTGFEKLSRYALITTLINCGADRSATVIVDGVAMDAAQLSNDPLIKEILAQK